MKLIHYSAKPLAALADPILLERPRIGKPPRGLWVSVESRRNDGWKWWCEAEKFGLDHLTNATEIVLKPKANVLWIKSAEAITTFEQEYPRPTKKPPGYYDIEADAPYVSHIDAIDWQRVMQDYAAIFIAPYQWSCRMDIMWYYGWDCASGVIWDFSIIETLRPAPEFARPKDEEAA